MHYCQVPGIVIGLRPKTTLSLSCCVCYCCCCCYCCCYYFTSL